MAFSNFDKICFRKASIKDSDTASSLTVMAYKDFAYDMLGVKTEEKVLHYFKSLWLIENNRFGYEYLYLVEKDSKKIMLCAAASHNGTVHAPPLKRLWFRVRPAPAGRSGNAASLTVDKTQGFRICCQTGGIGGDRELCAICPK